MERHKDHLYIEALYNSDTRLIKEIYQNHSEQIHKWILKNNGTTDDAKDIFQEALLTIYTKACDPDFILTCPFGAFLFRICRNKWIDKLRQKGRTEEVRIIEEKRYKVEEEQKVIPKVEEVEEENIKQQKLDKTFKKLSELCQQLLTLVADGRSSSEIVEKMEMAEANTFYRRKNACIERWRTLYKAA